MGVSFVAAESLRSIDSPSERMDLQKAFETAPQFRREVAGRKKVIATTMTLFSTRASPSSAEQQVVEALHFRYDDGKTIRTMFNATEQKVIRIDILEAYPTPLAGEEIEKAKELAKAKDAKIRQLIEGTPQEQLKIEFLSPVVSDKRDPRYGKRLVIVIVSSKDAPGSEKVTLNLTDETVSPH